MAQSESSRIWQRNLAPLLGAARRELPQSESRAPAADLAPWIARLSSARAGNDRLAVIACTMCCDCEFVRYISRGQWTAMTADGHDTYSNEVLLFGQQSRYMPIACTGDIIAAGFGLRAGALRLLTGTDSAAMLDRIERVDHFGLLRNDFFDALAPARSPAERNRAIEEVLRHHILRIDPEEPDPISAAFELAAFVDPTRSPSEFAEAHNISLRSLQRRIKRDFGLPPRLVMRRARALDLAALLCGVAREGEEQEILLRYFDQSHQIREFASFFGVTPRVFCASPRPLLAIMLEQRQARRLGEIARFGQAD